MIIVASPDRCKCNRELPWHLFELADEHYSHHCSCGRVYQWKSPTTAIVKE